MITVDIRPAILFLKLHDLLRMAFPEEILQESGTGGKSADIQIAVAARGENISCSGEIKLRGQTTAFQQEFALPPGHDDDQHRVTRPARIFTYRLLCRHLGENFNPYGILTGVRPVKIVHRLLDQGQGEEEIKMRLQAEYLLTADKAQLLLTVAQANHAFLATPAGFGDKLSVYIGVPFCPSRCYYCSFPGAIPVDYRTEVSPFVEALLTELEEIGALIRYKGWQVQSIYLGGGTPTLLRDDDIMRIFAALQRGFISASTGEITLEAGRPDTLNLPRLRMLQQAGVNRVCINPQTMHDNTLRLIGRKHDAGMIADAVGWARAAGIKYINMDLIVGLPGENRPIYLESAQKVLDLKPDNITVHTLAVKRGSLMMAEGRAGKNGDRRQVALGVRDLEILLQQQGYAPYYLYRQKYMQSGQENIGYTKPGCACQYNIQMIEERQNIIGLGGGASSKFINPVDGSLHNIHNPKEPQSYIKSLPGLIARKVDKLIALN